MPNGNHQQNETTRTGNLMHSQGANDTISKVKSSKLANKVPLQKVSCACLVNFQTTTIPIIGFSIELSQPSKIMDDHNQNQFAAEQ